MSERENYYIVLELDPTVSDPTRIQAQIAKKQAQWGNDAATGIARKARKADLYLDRLDDIRRVMTDPQARAAEAAAARHILVRAHKGKGEELVKAIELLCAKSHYTSAELKRLVAQFKDAFPAQEIEQRLSRRCPCQDQQARRRSPRRLRPLEDTIKRNIETNLQIVGASNLYDLLGAGPQTPARTLREQAQVLNQEILKIGQSTPQANARKALCGLALDLFENEERKQRYDDTLALSAMDGLRPNLDLAGAGKVIKQATLEALVEQAIRARIDKDIALDYIEQYAEKRGWHIATDEPLPVETRPVCGVCGSLADTQEQRHCVGCGHPLENPCPRCGTNTPTSNRACSHCGALTGDASLILGWVRQGEKQMAEGDMAGAIAQFERALAHWPDWGPAKDARRRAQERHEARESALADIQAQIRSGTLFAARDALKAFERIQGKTGVEDLSERLERGISDAEQACQAAQIAKRDGRLDEAFDHYSEALSHAADHPEAKVELERIPPPAPQRLEVRRIPAGFRLSWPAVRARGEIRYRIIGKAGGTPRHPEDGRRIAELDATILDDNSVEIGVPWHYCLYTLRKDVASKTGADSGPHLRTAEVGALTTRPSSGEVVLTWTPPPHCRRILVRRKAGTPPISIQDGEEIPATNHSAHDSGLVNGKGYGYRIAVQFDDPEHPGQTKTTKGITVMVEPVEPPPAIEDLSCRRDGAMVSLSWSPPSGTVVQIRKGRKPPSFKSGQRIDLQQTEQLGEAIAIHGPGSTQIRLEGQGLFYFIPLSVRGRLAVVGKTATLTSIDDIIGLKARTAGRNIVLTWTWPVDLQEVRILYRQDLFPQGPHDPTAVAKSVTRAQYERNGCWQLRNSETKPHFFRVYAKAPNTDAYSPGVGAQVLFGKLPTVRCRVRIERNLLGRIKGIRMVLSSQDVRSLEGISLVVANGHVPLGIDGGRLALTCDRIELKGGEANIGIPPHFWGKNRFANVFFRNPADAASIRLMPGGTDAMRLG